MSKRSKYTVEEKYDILVNYDNGVGSIEEICIKYKISTSTFYQWRYKCEKHGMDGLKKFAEKKNKETIEKVNKAIDKLKSSKNKKINFKTVSEEADVSKATLYNNDILKERILSLRVIKKGTSGIVVAHKDKIKVQDDRIKQLYEEIKKFKQDKQNLIIQLVEMEELRDENKRLKKQLIV